MFNRLLASLASAVVILASSTSYAQTDAYGKPAGFMRIEVQQNSELPASIPLDPFNGSLDSLLTGQLTGENSKMSADQIKVWDLVLQDYKAAFLAGNTNDQDKDGKWFLDDLAWQPSDITLSPGKGFFIVNNHATPQIIFFMGRVPLDSTRVLTLSSNLNFFSFPFASKIPLNSTTLKAGGAQGSATISGNSDIISTTSPEADYWLLNSAGNPSDGLWLDTASSPASIDAQMAGEATA